MQILNIGPGELLLIIVIMLIIFGPEDLINGARRLGRFIYRVTRSPIWREILATSQEIREIPKKIVEEAQLEETLNDIKETTREVNKEVSLAAQNVSAELAKSSEAINKSSEVALKSTSAVVATLPGEAAQPMESGLQQEQKIAFSSETQQPLVSADIVKQPDITVLPELPSNQNDHTATPTELNPSSPTSDATAVTEMSSKLSAEATVFTEPPPVPTAETLPQEAKVEPAESETVQIPPSSAAEESNLEQKNSTTEQLEEPVMGEISQSSNDLLENPGN